MSEDHVKKAFICLFVWWLVNNTKTISQMMVKKRWWIPLYKVKRNLKQTQGTAHVQRLENTRKNCHISLTLQYQIGRQAWITCVFVVVNKDIMFHCLTESVFCWSPHLWSIQRIGDVQNTGNYMTPSQTIHVINQNSNIRYIWIYLHCLIPQKMGPM